MFKLLLFALLFFFSSLSSYCQKLYKEGDQIEVDLKRDNNWVRATITGVNLDYYGKEITTIFYKLNSNGMMYYTNKSEFNLVRKPGETRTTSTAKTITPQNPYASVTCSFAPPPGNFNKGSQPSEALFKREIYDRYEWTVDGTTTAPLRVGLSFISFKIGTPYKNTVSIVPGRGAQRIHDGAPVNAIIYPAEAKYIVCEQYRTGISKKLVTSKYEFFIGRDGEWTLSGDPYATATTLDE